MPHLRLWGFAICGSALLGSAAHGGDFRIGATAVARDLDQPLFVTFAPCDEERLFIVERTGAVRILDLTTGELKPEPFIRVEVLAEGELGLLGMAFHPDYESNGYFYLNFSDLEWTTNVTRYTVSRDPDVADPQSALTLLTIEQPLQNHNGGWMGFGPNDGYLYIASGDGGPQVNGQDITDNLLGAILRIDVRPDGKRNYRIPPDNPFVGRSGDDEIWAYGLRNPYRCSFDRATADLWVGDVGRAAREEIDFQPAGSAGGENYGWPCMEGMWCTGNDDCACDDEALIHPIHDLTHEVSQAVIGGYVYRGSDIPPLQGSYVFGDFVTRVWSFDYDGEEVTGFTDWTSDTVSHVNRISSFGEDARGELYICALTEGDIYKIVPCPTDADVNCDGVINFIDLVSVLAAWGRCDGCDEDIDDDGYVNFLDLLIVLAEWTR